MLVPHNNHSKHPPSKFMWLPQPRTLVDIYRTRHKFPPVIRASNPIWKWLVTPITFSPLLHQKPSYLVRRMDLKAIHALRGRGVTYFSVSDIGMLLLSHWTTSHPCSHSNSNQTQWATHRKKASESQGDSLKWRMLMGENGIFRRGIRMEMTKIHCINAWNCQTIKMEIQKRLLKRLFIVKNCS